MERKTRGKRKSLKLNASPDPDFILIGISSHENDYRLVWAINNRLKCSFSRTDNLAVRQQGKDDAREFSRFVYEDEERLLTFTLISNRCPDGFLFPEIRNMDFFLQVIGELDGRSLEEWLKALRGVEIISGAYVIDKKSLKGLDRIVAG